ncbi:MAG: phosphotransferase [Pirellulaceae bacterium]
MPPCSPPASTAMPVRPSHHLEPPWWFIHQRWQTLVGGHAVDARHGRLLGSTIVSTPPSSPTGLGHAAPHLASISAATLTQGTQSNGCRASAESSNTACSSCPTGRDCHWVSHPIMGWRSNHAALGSHGPQLLPQLASSRDQPVALHFVLRDVWSDHVLFTDDRVTGIIDFGAARG